VPANPPILVDRSEDEAKLMDLAGIDNGCTIQVPRSPRSKPHQRNASSGNRCTRLTADHNASIDAFSGGR